MDEFQPSYFRLIKYKEQLFISLEDTVKCLGDVAEVLSKEGIQPSATVVGRIRIQLESLESEEGVFEVF